MATETIGSQVKIAMKLRGIANPSQLGKLSGVDRRTIGYLLSDRVKMRRTGLDRIADALRCKWDEEWTPDGKQVLILRVRKPRMRGN